MPSRSPVTDNKRVRLAPAVRRQQILEAALVEFTALGFTAASIAKIARRAGISKAGQDFKCLLMDSTTRKENAMAKVLGEARFDSEAQKWYYVICTDDGVVLFQSESEFASQEDAENELIYMLRSLAARATHDPRPPRI